MAHAVTRIRNQNLNYYENLITYHADIGSY